MDDDLGKAIHQIFAEKVPVRVLNLAMPNLFSGRAAMPFSFDLKKPLVDGMSLDIAGQCGKGGISISLSSELTVTRAVCLSIAARPSKRVIALNAMNGGVWDKELINCKEKWRDMFNQGGEFKLRIKATFDCYEIIDTSGREDVAIGNFKYRQDIDDKVCTYLVCTTDGAFITSISMND